MDVYDVLRVAASNGRYRKTANEMVREALRVAILSGQLPGGTRLMQAEIAATLDVSTTPVREALMQLAADGLIQFDPHRGAVVHEIDLAELREIYEIRTALEQIAVRQAATNITDDLLDEAAELIKEMDGTDEPAVWVQRNWEFHQVVEQGSGAKRLLNVIKSVQDSASLYVAHSLQVNPKRMREANGEHRALLAAIRKKDGDRAAKILGDHLNHTIAAIARDAAAHGI